MEAGVERENLNEALARVKHNKDTAYIDRMSVNDPPVSLKEHWPTTRTSTVNGSQ
jgi:RNA-directed DNA polymerase